MSPEPDTPVEAEAQESPEEEGDSESETLPLEESSDDEGNRAWSVGEFRVI